MAKHLHTGKAGESIAQQFLQQKGYIILHTNWRHGKCEVDIIALLQNLLVFVEVKTRSTNYFGYPEEAVSRRKQLLLAKAANAYTELLHPNALVRFDVISVTLPAGQEPEIYHIEDAFALYDE
ncbi:hypothetical protein BVG80_17935 [Sphingobacteriales bacterium TSM_CSM]|nr:hypothetical protein BVG80_17935 [Sphingobacteriales bacterium TSM_CSM]